MSIVSLESIVRPAQGEQSLPRPYYQQGQRTPQNIKMRFGGGSGGSLKTLGTSESGSLTTYMQRHEVEKNDPEASE
jgi:hypothetical protein